MDLKQPDIASPFPQSWQLQPHWVMSLVHTLKTSLVCFSVVKGHVVLLDQLTHIHKPSQRLWHLALMKISHLQAFFPESDLDIPIHANGPNKDRYVHQK